jgi:hypothetical protein
VYQRNRTHSPIVERPTKEDIAAECLALAGKMLSRLIPVMTLRVVTRDLNLRYRCPWPHNTTDITQRTDRSRSFRDLG